MQNGCIFSVCIINLDEPVSKRILEMNLLRFLRYGTQWSPHRALDLRGDRFPGNKSTNQADHRRRRRDKLQETNG